LFQPLKGGEGLNGIRKARAEKLGLQNAHMFTAEEADRYEKLAGQKTREAVQKLRQADKQGRFEDGEQRQDTLDSMVSAARRSAKYEVMMEGQK
jgi:hypothetical protein